MTTFVLVHGAWHGGWCYKQVARLLRQAGHEVYTPTLTGLGERAHLMNRTINLDTHVQDIVGVMRCEELSDVVVWSFLWRHGHHRRRRADRGEDSFASLSRRLRARGRQVAVRLSAGRAVGADA
jgi:Alpha/beta hydrolase family